jgi:hypothetical protein
MKICTWQNAVYTKFRTAVMSLATCTLSAHHTYTVQACQTEMLKVQINYFNEAQISDRKRKSAYPASLVFLSPLKSNKVQYIHIQIQFMLQTEHSLLPLRKTNLRILYRKIIVVYRANHMEHMHCEGNMLFGTKPLSACKGDCVQRLGLHGTEWGISEPQSIFFIVELLAVERTTSYLHSDWRCRRLSTAQCSKMDSVLLLPSWLTKLNNCKLHRTLFRPVTRQQSR